MKVNSRITSSFPSYLLFLYYIYEQGLLLHTCSCHDEENLSVNFLYFIKLLFFPS